MNKLIKVLLINIPIFLTLCFTGCRVYEKTPDNDYKIINYLFYPDVDTLLTHYLDSINSEYEIEKLFIELRYRHISGGRYYLVLYHYNHLIFKENTSTKGQKRILNLLLQRTNRYAVINKGQYIIPLIFDCDKYFSPYLDEKQTSPSLELLGGELLIIFDYDYWDVKKYEVNPDVNWKDSYDF